MKWEVKPLGDFSKIMYGYTDSASFGKSGPRFLRITDIQDNRVDWSQVPSCDISPSELGKYRLESGDIVFARTGATTGKSFLLADPPEAVFASYLIRVQISEPVVLPEYLNLYFQSGDYWDTINAGLSGSAQGGFNASKLGELRIPLPPRPEQQRIVGKLDAAFAALGEAQALMERNRANARELFESYLNGVFERKGDGWVEKQLTDVAKIRTGKVDANHQADDGEYAFYTCAFGQFKSPTWSFEGPSVILPGNGANVGVTFFYNGRFEAYQRTYVVNEFAAEVNPRFAYFCFRAGWKPYIATRQFGSATNYIVLGDLKQFPVHLPSLKEQTILLGEFEEMEQRVLELEATYQQKLSELAVLKKGLLGAAFRGEL